MPPNTRRILTSAAVLLPVLCCFGAGSAGANALCPRKPKPVVGVSDIHLTLDGKMWLPRRTYLTRIG